jgi:transposase InsO family protein
MRGNAIAERWVGSARRECLNWILIAGERHLRLVLSEYADHYNLHRPHRALQQGPPAGRPQPPNPDTDARVLRRDRLGGLIREYAQVAQGDRVFGTHNLRHCNAARPHRALGQLAPAQAHARPPQINLAEHRIRRKQVLGGLTHEYQIAA